jgi:FKBP-type peptidyl-prolyl cis-trans isomerase (trigger factor)
MASKQPPKKGTGAPTAKPSDAKAEQKRSDARATTLEAGRHLQRILDQAPGATISKRAGVDDSVVKTAQRVLELAEKVEVHVPAGQVTERDINTRIDQVRSTLSLVEPKAVGSTLQTGDEVLLDLLGYLGGDVFLADTDNWYQLLPNKLLPGLFESLVGARVPDHRMVYVKLPDDYPVAVQAGQTAVFAVTITEARKRTLPEVTDPLFLPFLNRGVKSLPELQKQIGVELTQERAMQMVEHAKLLLLRELYVRCMGDDVPENLVDEELTRRWRDLQGESLARQGVPIEDQKKSQQAYLGDPTMRAEARRTVWEYRMLDAVADALNIEVSETTLRPILSQMFGPTVDLDAILYKNPGLHKDLIKGLRMKRAAEALLKKTKVAFDGAPTDPKQPYKPLVEPETLPKANVTASRGLKRPPSKAK